MTILRPFLQLPSIQPQRILYKEDPTNEGRIVYADVYPQIEGQDEDVLNEEHIRNGYILPPLIRNETPSAFDVIHEKLSASLGVLTSLGRDIIKTQHSTAISGKSSFQIPERIYMTDSNKESWFDDLANSQKSLSELAIAKVPIIGLKDKRILDTLADRRVPFERAIWLIKCIGFNEMRPQKVAPTLIQNQNTSKDWTKVVCLFLSEKIMALSGTEKDARKSQPLSNVAKEEAFRLKLRQIRYFTHLCRLQFDYNLIYRQDFLKQILLLFQRATHANQIPVMVSIVSHYIKEISESRMFSKQLLFNSLTNLRKVSNSSSETISKALVPRLRQMVQTIILAIPDLFVSGSVWKMVLTMKENVFDNLEYLPVQERQRLLEIKKIISQRVSDIYPSIILTQNSLTIKKIFDKAMAAADAQVQLDHDSNLNEIIEYPLLDCTSKIHEYYAAGLLISKNLNGINIRRLLLEFFRDQVLDSKKSEYLSRLCSFYGVLQNFGLISYQDLLKYFAVVQRNGNNASEKTKLLDWMGLIAVRNQPPNIVSQRLLWMPDTAQRDEDFVLQGQKLICETFSTMFDSEMNVIQILQEPIKKSVSVDLPPNALQFFKSISPYCQMRIAEWLRDSVYLFIVHAQTIGINNWKTLSVPGTSVLSCQQFCQIVVLFEEMGDLHTLLEISIWIMGKTFDDGILRAIVYSFQRNEYIYASLGFSNLIFTTLWKKFIFDRQQKYRIYPAILSTLTNYNKYGEKKDLSFLKTKASSSNKDKSYDFGYLKELTAGYTPAAKILARSVADCRNRALLFLSSSIEILQGRFQTMQFSSFLKDVDEFGSLFVHAQECGTVLEDAWKSIISQYFSSNMAAEKIADPFWFFHLLATIIANQGISLTWVLTNVFIPFLNRQSFFETDFNLGLASKIITLLAELLYSQELPNRDSEFIQAVKTFQSCCISSPETEFALFEIVITLQTLANTKADLVSPPLLVKNVQDFIENLTSKAIFLKNQFLRGDLHRQLSNISSQGSDVYRTLFRFYANADFGIKCPLSVTEMKKAVESVLHQCPFRFRDTYLMTLIQHLNCSRELEKHQQDIIDWLVRYLLQSNDSFTLDLNTFCATFAPSIKAPFLKYIEELRLEILQLDTCFNDGGPFVKITPFAWGSENLSLVKLLPPFITVTFGGGLPKDSSRKAEKDALVLLADTLCKAICSFLKWEKVFVRMVQDDISLSEAFNLTPDTSNLLLPSQKITHQEICTTILQYFLRYIIDFLEELPSVIPLIQKLLLLLKSPFLAIHSNKSLEDSVFDIVMILGDDIAKSKSSSAMASWMLEEFAPLVSRHDSFRVISLLPFQEPIRILEDLYTTPDLKPVAEMETILPWELIECGVTPAVPPPAEISYGRPSSAPVSYINDTCISLASFGARKIRPRLNTFEELFQYGWRPETPSIRNSFSCMSLSLESIEEKRGLTLSPVILASAMSSLESPGLPESRKRPAQTDPFKPVKSVKK